MKYIHPVYLHDDEYCIATATTVDEAKELAAIGFTYSTNMKGIQISRKPKLFEKA
ncbi:hypothetical protein GTO27_05505 [Candidatus Bathyarchaeota archaeon]|nr:hypothetical protein [Candidatus Bathyarchaeota archaeon]